MADEATAVVAEAAEQPANAAPTGAEPGQQTEAARTFTQAELDRIVTERLAKEKARTEAAVKRAQDDAEAKRLAEAGEFKALFEKATAELEAERQARKALELAGLRRDTAARYSLPAALADRLRGETADELDADAQELLKSLPKPAAPNINAGDAPGQTAKLPGGMTEASIREQATRLGVGFEAFKAALLNGK